MRVLVTGLTGFVGRHLAKELRQHGHDVFGTFLGSIPKDFAVDPSSLHHLDISDHSKVLQLVEHIKPEAVIHLAGIATTTHAAKEADHLFRVNVCGTANIAHAVHVLKSDVSLLVVSSAFVYGGSEESGRHIFSETSPVSPRGIYGSTKLAAEFAAQFFASDLCRVYVARPFNHVGVGQDSSFVVPGFVKRIKNAKNGDTIETGSLNAFRDFTDVRDVVRGYRRIIELKPHERCFVFGSGRSYQIKQVFDRLCQIANKNLNHHVNESFVRGHDSAQYLADFSLAERVIGWRPEIALDESLKAVSELAIDVEM